jgi:hypothetical protein
VVGKILNRRRRINELRADARCRAGRYVDPARVGLIQAAEAVGVSCQPFCSDRSGFHAEVDKLAKDVATLQLGVAFIDAIKLEVARDQMIEFQVALLPRVQ